MHWLKNGSGFQPPIAFCVTRGPLSDLGYNSSAPVMLVMGATQTNVTKHLEIASARSSPLVPHPPSEALTSREREQPELLSMVAAVLERSAKRLLPQPKSLGWRLWPGRMLSLHASGDLFFFCDVLGHPSIQDAKRASHVRGRRCRDGGFANAQVVSTAFSLASDLLPERIFCQLDDFPPDSLLAIPQW